MMFGNGAPAPWRWTCAAIVLCSSRRRHTRCSRDWSSDVCSSDLFYRIGTARGKSVCVMLCDEWFECKGDIEGYVRQDEWLMSFRPGAAGEIEEVADEARWRQRVLRDRPLHDLDFCMTDRKSGG